MICTFKIIPYLCSCIFHGIRLLRLKSEIGCREITNLFFHALIANNQQAFVFSSFLFYTFAVRK